MKFLKTYSLSFIAIASFLIVWEIAVALFSLPKWILPAPHQIFETLWVKRELLFMHSLYTIFETLLGLTIATIVGFGIAIAMEWSSFFRKLFKPFLVISQTIPFIALAPLLVVWFGYGLLPKIIVITLACFFPIALSLYDGFKAADSNMIRLLKSMGAKKSQIFRMVKIPASLPAFFSGFRIAGAYAVGVAVVSEWIGAENGLGIFLIRSARSYLTDSVFAVIFVVTTLSLLTIFLIDQLTKIAIPWYFHKKEGGVV
ncbi:MAG TPA: ABC transporter permease [Patescibacteria group bacterium]|nr:ABC transporter permease [Patescibacteria group bacterium]